MAKINLPQFKKTISSKKGLTLMQVLLDAEIPVASSCGGDGICGKCVVNIDSPRGVPTPSDLETKTLKKNSTESDQRLSCQIEVSDHAVVKTSYW